MLDTSNGLGCTPVMPVEVAGIYRNHGNSMEIDKVGDANGKKNRTKGTRGRGGNILIARKAQCTQ